MLGTATVLAQAAKKKKSTPLIYSGIVSVALCLQCEI